MGDRVGEVAGSQARQFSEKDLVPRIVTGMQLVVNHIEPSWFAQVIGYKVIGRIPVAKESSTRRLTPDCTVRGSHRAQRASRRCAAGLPIVGMVEANWERCGDSNIAHKINGFCHYTDPTIGEAAWAANTPL